MIDRQKPFYSKQQAEILYQRGLMPEYVYRQLYFTGQENLLYYHNKREKEAEEKIKAKQQETLIEKTIEDQIEKGVNEALEKLFGK